MPPKRNQTKNKHANKNKPSAMADCVFPQNIMVSILTRLPVKSLLRFKVVCKPWLKLFANPNFIKAHYRQFSDDPVNQAFIIYSLSKHYFEHTMSLFKIESNAKKPTDLAHPYPEIFFRMNFIGSCNGLLCMGCPPLGQAIVLWNPATKLYKFVRLSKEELGNPEMVSLGFGYDEERDDFKVVRVVCVNGKKIRVRVEVYSSKSDSWKTIKLGFQFHVFRTKNDAIVNGNPYWLAKIYGSGSGDSRQAIVWFDVREMAFKKAPLANLEMKEGTQIPMVDWKGSVGAIMSSENKHKKGSVDVYVWVFDEGEKIWNLKGTFGPVELKVATCMQCSKNGKIIGFCFDGKLFVFDPVKGWVKVIEMEEAQARSYEVYGYSESLACVEGMKPVVVKKEEDDVVAGGMGPEEEDDNEVILMSHLHLHG